MVIFIKDLFTDLVGWTVVPRRVFRVVQLNGRNRSRADVGAAPFSGCSPKALADNEFAMFHGFSKGGDCSAAMPEHYHGQLGPLALGLPAQSRRRIKVLQTSALPLGFRADEMVRRRACNGLSGPGSFSRARVNSLLLYGSAGTANNRGQRVQLKRSFKLPVVLSFVSGIALTLIAVYIGSGAVSRPATIRRSKQ